MKEKHNSFEEKLYTHSQLELIREHVRELEEMKQEMCDDFLEMLYLMVDSDATTRKEIYEQMATRLQKRILEKNGVTCLRVCYCVYCDWFTQQTLYTPLYVNLVPDNCCSQCKVEYATVDIEGRRHGDVFDVSVNAEGSIKQYSQEELKKIYFENGGFIPVMSTFEHAGNR